MRVAVEAFDVDALRRELQHPGCGGYCAFEGWVRDSNAGAPVDGLDYEAYAELAIAEGERIVAEASERFEIRDARCVHRVGALTVGDLAIWIGVSAPHRDAAFRACRYIIDQAKHRLPVWKKEHYLDGESSWIATRDNDVGTGVPTYASTGDVVSATVGRDPRPAAPTVANAEPFTPDYSRQTQLPGFGIEGQARLAASRVLVIGAGGLGVPVLSYLAAAGVGTLGIVDGDRLEASNLHRQVLYAAGDVGEWKVDAAARRLQAINPAVNVEVFRGTLSADDIEAVFARYDLVVECTDAIDSKYLSSDAAVLTGTPIVFASVYQHEGQLHAYAPEGRSPCLRCLWPTPPDPGVVGTCAQAGVLGPVPGVLGAMQAIEAIKRLVGLPGAIDDALLLVNLADYGLQRIAAPRRAPCAQAGQCVVVRDLARWRAADALELAFDSLSGAVAAGYTLVDIRNDDEIAAQPIPLPSRRMPIAPLLDGTVELGVGRHLLVCARGQRSRALAERLRERGVAGVWSLRNGLAGLP